MSGKTKFGCTPSRSVASGTTSRSGSTTTGRCPIVTDNTMKLDDCPCGGRPAVQEWLFGHKFDLVRTKCGKGVRGYDASQICKERAALVWNRRCRWEKEAK